MTANTVRSTTQQRSDVAPTLFRRMGSSSAAIPLAALYFFTLSVGAFLIIEHLGLAGYRTLAFFFLIATAGVWYCEQTRKRTHDPKLRRLSYFWLIKLIITFVLLFAGWMPELEPSLSGSWGYDPQRYYQYSKELLLANWDISWLSLNYTGIVYYYAVLFYIFGQNPIAPALLNAFVTLLGILFVVRFAYSTLPQPLFPRKAWTLSLLILVPELLWYDVMTSRETLMAVLLIVTSLLLEQRIAPIKQKPAISPTSFAVIVALAIGGIVTIRTPMVFSVVSAVLIYSTVVKTGSSNRLIFRFLLIAALAGLVLVGPQLQSAIGGYEFDIEDVISRVSSVDENTVESRQWAAQSIGRLLVPNNIVESALFLPPRMLLYIAAPLPNVDISFSALAAGSWSEWQRLMVIPTSVLMLFFFPYVLAGTQVSWRQRKKYPSMLIMPVAFWATFAVVAAGNYMIHERYRIMFTPLLFATMWLGFVYCRRAEVKKVAYFWYALLGGAAAFYLVYKWIL